MLAGDQPRRTHAAVRRRSRHRVRHAGMGRAHREPARVGCRRHGEPELGQRALRAARARHRHGHARRPAACRSRATAGATTRADRATDDARRLGRPRDPGLCLPGERPRLGLLALLHGRRDRSRSKAATCSPTGSSSTRASSPRRGCSSSVTRARSLPVALEWSGGLLELTLGVRSHAVDVDAAEPRRRQGPVRVPASCTSSATVAARGTARPATSTASAPTGSTRSRPSRTTGAS